MTKPKRTFALSPAAAAVVGESKVQTAGDLPVIAPPQGGETSTTPPAVPALEAAGAAQAAEPAQPPAEVEKTAPVPAPQAEAPKPKPWENATSAPKGLNFQPSAELHAKMEWVSGNVPGGMSRLRMLREGVELLCNQLIEKHYREEGK